jgi:diguanylate cyclase (GGDEF)-like protein/PAS domain S-box-containing protein
LSIEQAVNLERTAAGTRAATSDPRVKAELLDLVYASTPVVLAANVINGALLALVIGPVIGGSVVAVWYGLLAAMAAVRVVAWAKYRRDTDRVARFGRWALVTVTGSGASGLLWGAAGALFLVADSPLHYVLLVLVLGGMGAGAVAALAPHPPALAAYLFPSLLPLCFRLVSTGEPAHQAMAGMVVIYVIGVFIVGRRAHAWLSQSLLLRLENAELLRSLERRVEERTDELRHANVRLCHDIAEREQAERALQHSERRFKDFAASASDWFWEMGPDLRFIWVSDQITTLLGVSPEDVIGKTRNEIAAAWASDEQWSLHLRDMWDRRPFKDFRYRITDADGETLHMSVSGVPVFGDNREFLGYRGTGANITKQTRAEEALFEEKERAQVTLHSIGDAVITTDAKRVVEYLNPVAETLTGWTNEEARGLSLDTVFRIIEEDSRELAPDPVARCLGQGKIVGLTSHSVLIDRHGREYAIEDTAAPIRDGEGRVLGAVLVFHDVSETRRMARQLAHDATHDALTGLINRREFERRLEHTVMSTKRHGTYHVLCYLDLDQFKLVNDTAGHAAGDELLKRVRGLLAGKFRDRDTLARLGGDEFGLLLDNCELPEALGICDIIVATFRDYRFKWQGRSFRIGASMGLVPVTADAESAAQLLSQADVACYTAKELGRSQVHVYRKEGAQPSRRHTEIILVSGLQDALEQNRFVLYCQPIVDLSPDDGAPLRFEVLLRLRDGGDLVLPHAFIPAAERYGLMAAIDRWVVRRAFRRCTRIFGAESNVEIAINLSGNSLSDDSLLDFLTEQFAASTVSPGQVCFEITETSAIRNLGKAAEFLTEIKKMGCRFALDDFGAGLSSFTYLKTFPADYLKIDGSFVRDMADSAIDQAMVAAINEVGHTLGMKTIAESVESEVVAERLATLGVDWAQGYALGVPVPFDETVRAPRVH